MKKTILIIAALVLACTSSSAKDKEEPLGPETWPVTVKAAVSDILSSMPSEDKETVRKAKETDLILFHVGWGMGIRNHYGLWRGNNKLIEDACGKGCHPDNASMVIIKAVWTTLQQPQP